MLFTIPSQIGYVALAGFVAAESAGVPVPGESALVAAGLLSRGGHLSLPLVIAVAAVAAVLGDNLGYWLGRRGGRAMLLRDGRTAAHRRRAVQEGDRFFARHGARTVFMGRWVTGVRIVAAVLAGASHMPWRTFAVYNALGAVAWATTIAGTAALLGPVVVGVVYVGGIVALGVGLALTGWRAARRRPATGAGRPQPARAPGS